MPKPVIRSYSRYAREATELLGQIIRTARTERALTVADVAERAGTSRGLVHRIEKGDMGCSIGAAFEIAAMPAMAGGSPSPIIPRASFSGEISI